MSREEINDIVCEIMRRDGPDGHTDGSDVITDFIMALLDSSGSLWARNYRDQQ